MKKRNVLIILTILLALVSCDNSVEERAPLMPDSPFPGDNSVDNDVSLILSWKCNDKDNVQFDIFLDTIEDPKEIASNIVGNKHILYNLEYNKVYYWYVIAKNSTGIETKSPIWSFTTQKAINTPFPPNNTDLASNTITLSWNHQNNSNTENYEVYFGNNNPPSFFQETNNKFIRLTNIEPNTTYYWKIIAKSNSGNQYESNLWMFNTGNQPKEKEFELANSGIKIPMIWIEAGDFMMGAQEGEIDAMGDEYPRHKVTIKNGFWIGKYEITQEQWKAVVGDWNFNFNNNPYRPAENVSWDHIHSLFIDKLNSYESSNVWRLPSESEWEYACRAGKDETRFWWGNDPDYKLADNYVWSSQNSNNQTHDVGLRLPNQWGLFDMNGNVWEWCEDQYHNSYVNAPNDGSVWGTGSANGKVARGGSWGKYGVQFCRSASRARDNPIYGYNTFGFRLVRNDN